MSLRVALAQLNSTADPQHNLDLIADQVTAAAAEQADLLVLPEAMMRSFGHELAPVAEPVDGPWARGVSDLAVRHGLTVVVGMFTPAPATGGTSTPQVRNTLIACAPDGSITGYDKIHLFDAFDFAESETVARGEEPVLIDINGISVGLTTCYDVRFSELYVELARRGAEVIIIAASWGSGPGKEGQWDLLTRARALDSGSWVLACGQADPTGGRHGVEGPMVAPTGVGYSQVITPYGVPTVTAGPGPELLVTTIEPSMAPQARQRLGILTNRRLR